MPITHVAPTGAIDGTEWASAHIGDDQRPFPAPITSGTVTISGSIDATGGTNVAAALQAAIDAAPNGRIIDFPAGAIYRIDTALLLQNRSHLLFRGNGATLRSGAGTGLVNTNSLFYTGGLPVVASSNIAFRDFILEGNDPTPGTYTALSEAQAGLTVHGGSHIELSRCTIRKMYGDGLCVNADAQYVWMHHCTVETVGRNGVSVIAGKNVTIEDSEFTTCGYSTFDIEPFDVNSECSDIIFRRTTAGTNENTWLSAAGNISNVNYINRVTFTQNEIRGPGGAATYPTTAGPNGSFHIVINRTTPRWHDITVTDNIAGEPWDYQFSPVAFLENIDRLIYSGNTVPLSGSGQGTSTAGSNFPTNPRVLSLASAHAISSTTATEVTGLGPCTLEAGTYTFRFMILAQSATATVSPMFGVNFTGTAAVKHFVLRYPSTGAGAGITGVADDVGATSGQLMESVAQTAYSTTSPNLGATGGVATTATNILYVIEGLMIVTAVGDLELWHGSETATSTTVSAGTSLIVERTV